MNWILVHVKFGIALIEGRLRLERSLPFIVLVRVPRNHEALRLHRGW
jgi:hypothetical protein